MKKSMKGLIVGVALVTVVSAGVLTFKMSNGMAEDEKVTTEAVATTDTAGSDEKADILSSDEATTEEKKKTSSSAEELSGNISGTIESKKDNVTNTASKETTDTKKPTGTTNNKKSNEVNTTEAPKPTTTAQSQPKVEVKPEVVKPTTTTEVAKPEAVKPTTEAPVKEEPTKEEPKKQEHTHKWVAVTKTVHHDAVTHEEQKVVKKAWTEKVKEFMSYCHGCNQIIGKYGTYEDTLHTTQCPGTMDSVACQGLASVAGVEVVVDTIEHPAEYETVTVVDREAYDEEVVTGYKCSCGATK